MTSQIRTAHCPHRNHRTVRAAGQIRSDRDSSQSAPSSNRCRSQGWRRTFPRSPDGAATLGRVRGGAEDAPLPFAASFSTALRGFRIEHQRDNLFFVSRADARATHTRVRLKIIVRLPPIRRLVFSVEATRGTLLRSRPFRLKLVSCLTAGSSPHLQNYACPPSISIRPRARQTFRTKLFLR